MQKLLSIQMLRGIAALMVVYHHCVGYMIGQAEVLGVPQPVMTTWGAFADIGSIGVDVFFVISGFIMFYISKDVFAKQGASVDFIKRRIIRIAPMYWIFSIGYFILMYAREILKAFMPSSFSGAENTFSWEYIVNSIFFVPSFGQTGQIYPILPPGWTLIYEMYFYVLFAILLFFPRKMALPSLTVFFTASIALGIIFNVQEIAVLKAYSSTILLEFLAGCFIAHAYINSKMINVGQSLALIALSIIILVLGAPQFDVQIDYIANMRAVYWGIPSVLIVVGVLSLEKAGKLPAPKSLVWLGDISYTLYLSHAALGVYVFGKALVLSGVLNYVSIEVVVLIQLLGCIAIAAGFYYVIERPVTKFLLKNKMFFNKVEKITPVNGKV